MNIVVSDPKTGKAFSKKTEDSVFLNRKIREEVDLAVIGMPGYKGKITGGSDKQGFPMKGTVQGAARKKTLLKKGIGLKEKKAGLKKRKSVRGNTVGPETMQINIAITKHGDKALDAFVEKKEGAKTEEEKQSAKERLVKQSLENVGNVDLAGDAKKAKGKVRR